MGVNSQFIALGKLGDSSRVADDAASLHTPTMTLKNAALLALIGTILATVLLVWTFASTVVNVLRGLAPAVMLDPLEPQNWYVSFRILELEGAWTSENNIPRVEIDLSVPEPPPLPERNDGPKNPHKPGTEQYFQWDREQVTKGIDAHWDKELGPALQEISDASGKTIPASLANAVRDDLIAKNISFTRYNIRRSFAYLRAGEIPDGVYEQRELDQFEADRKEELMSAEDYKTINFRRQA